MTVAQGWNGIERRKARPSRESIIELLHHFGTEYPEPEKNAPALRKKYYDLLSRPWAQRGKGLSHNAALAITILLACFLFLSGGILLILFAHSGVAGSHGMGVLSYLAIGVWGIFIFGMMLYVLSIMTINYRTRANTFRKFSLVRQAAQQLADTSKTEVVRDYIPILKIFGKTYFQIVYMRNRDAAKTPTGILVLDDQGRAILKYGALENTKLTASICITCGHVLQQRSDNIRRSMKNVVDKQIPDAVRILKNQEQQFSKYGLSPRWTSVMEGASILPQALQESITILDGEEAFRKAMGYAFALEFYYEDALWLRELYLAYVKYFNAAYRRKIISLTTESAMLIQILESKTEWQDQNAALAALSTLAVAGTNGLLSRICQKEYEGIVNDADRKAYEEKTQQAKKMGVPVISE
jgi:hypothetical protein